jgi:hypothetical protein
MNDAKRRRVGRPSGPTKIYWAIRMTARQRDMIRKEARKHRVSYGEFIYQCVQNCPVAQI